MKNKNHKILRDYLIGWFIAALIWFLLSNVHNVEHVEIYSPNSSFWEETLIMGMFWLVQGLGFYALHIFIERFVTGRVPFIKLMAITITFQLVIAVLAIALFFVIIKIFTDLIQTSSVWEILQLPLIPTAIFYALVVNFGISISIRVSMILGDGTLFKIITGKFYQPKVEELIFMFLDLKGSTTIAERIDHTDYSKLLQDCFYDLAVVHQFKAEIYQYVGDEAVLVWNTTDGINNMNCIKAYYAFEERIIDKASYYQEKYGIVPEFKAGLQIGEVTVAEVGELKREIAYHGDTINTASRIQKQCNALRAELLVSEKLLNLLELTPSVRSIAKGAFHLQGKKEELNLFAIEKNTWSSQS
ncbi:adenylate/guanylate cyclase domain-containing protein [Flammeovirgaceae bacterium SG7u.111]|nr:adenylate/guanylate cyclase domain-containing protein [Flammeovirgaceae bacterium SG7u.132]WPO36093.1 adenylate/guanylate cyclase domain-containing protein [Flammeovirgaceae bacterium SG7u.111]